MLSAVRLHNHIKEYFWGSFTSIPRLLNLHWQGDKPCAEYWMGTHPSAPSTILTDSGGIELSEMIRVSPDEMLGKKTAKLFQGTLPFLFKIIAVEKSLSIQVHPSKKQAERGFDAEQAQHGPKNYADRNGKPEMLCALTPFSAMAGFRPVAEIREFLEKIAPGAFKSRLPLKELFLSVFALQGEQKKTFLWNVERFCRTRAKDGKLFAIVLDLLREYPGDPGIAAPFFLNVVHLNPLEAIYIPSGEVHAYLKGTGLEVMASSDNVLRCGLTPKKVDLAEFAAVSTFDKTKVLRIDPENTKAGERYKVPVKDFALFRIVAKKDKPYQSGKIESIEILLCLKGSAKLTAPGMNDPLKISQGDSICVPAALEQYTITGDAEIFKATVG